jgi:hypothetical protein
MQDICGNSNLSKECRSLRGRGGDFYTVAGGLATCYDTNAAMTRI